MLALVDLPPQPASPLDAAVYLADEGVPVRAIARSLRIPGEDVYEILKDAIAAGRITELPKDDWPIGSTRRSRTVFHGTPLEQEDALRFACARAFKVTKLESAILATLLRRNEVTKQQLHQVIEQNRPSENREETDPKMVDVLICHLRKKLLKHSLAIDTVWGMGYLISAVNRDLAYHLLTGEPAPALLKAA